MALLWLLIAIVVAVLLFLHLVRAPAASVEVVGRHVLITGGSSGIGLELAKLIALEGAKKITLLARNSAGLRKACDEVQATGSKSEVSILCVDVTEYSEVQKAIDSVGQIDVLVCSHGLTIPMAFVDASIEDLHRVVDVNFKGTMNVVKAALPGMKRSRPGDYARSIAIFSSQAGQTGVYGYTSYGGTKAALIRFGEALKQELLGDNIQVTIVYPPDTNTPGFVAENATKPEITKLLSASSSAAEAMDVATISLQGLKAGKFTVPCSFDGHLLAVACSGMSPQTSAIYSLLEIIFLPVTRIIGLCVLFGWYRTIRSQQKKLP